LQGAPNAGFGRVQPFAQLRGASTWTWFAAVGEVPP